MADPLSLLDASGQAGPTSTFDASAVDANIKAIGAVEASWRLPALPEDVKLDLASQPGVTQDHLTNLLYGLEADFHGDQPAPPPLYQAPVLPQFNTLDKARRIVTDVASNKPATIVDSSAIQRWKMAAIDGGYLNAPADGQITNAWSPELDTVRKSMAYDQYNTSQRGNRAGAMSFGKMVDQLGKWTSPSGLLAAATSLDLFWDFGAVGKEFNTWGDKWRKLGKSKNPFDFAKNLVDAITGPIDDLLMPVANWAMLASGVGEAYDFARVAYAGSEAIAGTEAVTGLYKASGFTKFVAGGYDAGADVKRMQEASGLALRLGKSGNAAVSGLGDTMGLWRNLDSVATSKKLLQVGMRAGIASQAENLLPGYQGGKSLADTAPVQGAVTWAQSNPLLMAGAGVAELFLTPYSTFRPGSFTGTAKAVVGKTAAALGTTGGRVALGGLLGAGVGTWLGEDTGDTLKGAAIGALGLASVPLMGKGLSSAAAAVDRVPLASKIMPKSVGLVGDFLQNTSWKPLADNQQLTMAFHQGVLASLTGPALEKYQAAFDEKGFLHAFATHFGVDEETAGASMGFVMTSAAIDHIASSQAKNADNFSKAYHEFRNKLVAQVRGFDLSNVGAHTIDEVAWSASLGVNGQKREFASLRDIFKADPAQALLHAESHNRNAQETLQQLLSVEATPDLNPNLAASLYGWNDLGAPDRAAVISKYLPQVMDSFGNWPEFSARTSEIRGLLHDGLLDDAVFDTYKLPSGLERPTLAARAVPVVVHPTNGQLISQGINDLVFRTPGTDITTITSRGKLDVLARGVDPSIGRFTAMKTVSADKGQVLTELEKLKELKAIHEIALPHTGVLAAATASSGELTDLTRQQYAGVINSMVKGSSSQKGMRRLYDFAKREGIPLADMKTYLNDAIQGAVDDPKLTDWLGLPKVITGKPNEGEVIGAVLSGPAALKARIGQLQQKADYTAARIDGPKLLASLGEGTPEYLRMQAHLDSLERDGYKLVHGVEFLMPEDIAHQTPIFEDITRRHMNAVTLGNFFKGRLPAVARFHEEQRHVAIIQDELSKIGKDVSLNSQDVSNLRDDLTSILRSKQALSEEVRTNAETGTWMTKRLAGIRSSTTPMSLADLGRTDWRDVIKTLAPVYGDEIAQAAPKMLRRMRNTEFKDVGLYAIEAKLRTQNQFSSALKVLSGTEHGESFMAHSSTARKVGALAGGVYGAETSDNNTTGFLEGAAIGAAAGTVAQGALSPLFAKAEKAFEASKWFQYGYLADDLAGMRDTLRFTLSPFFDLSRMAKSQELGQTAAPLRNSLGERIVMPLNSSPAALKASWVKTGLSKVEADQKFKTTAAQFQSIIRGADKGATEGDFVAADNLANYFQQVGILGHNPAEWQITAYQHLVDQGVDKVTAARQARDMYTYGTAGGRSAAEMSVNFIFFPFSFQKKAYTALARYVSDDLSRAVVLHDAVKGYELLDQKYNLKQMWKDHLPALEKLQQLNMFAYGASLGKLGGLNRPFIEPVMNMAANLHGQKEFVPGILNLFNPQGVSVKSAADAVDIKKLVRSLTPVYNDINYLLGDSKEQFHALTSASKQTYAADANDGWSAWNKYKTEFHAALDKQGLKMADLSQPWAADAKLAYSAKRADIEAQYPGWKDSRVKSREKAGTLDLELQDRMDRVANGNGSEADLMTFQFNQALQATTADQKLHGAADPTDWTSDARQRLIDMAVAFARGSMEWRNIYGKFFSRTLGPITSEVRFG